MGSLFGGGIAEDGRVCTDCVSIGMFTNPGAKAKGRCKDDAARA